MLNDLQIKFDHQYELFAKYFQKFASQGQTKFDDNYNNVHKRILIDHTWHSTAIMQLFTFIPNTPRPSFAQNARGSCGSDYVRTAIWTFELLRQRQRWCIDHITRSWTQPQIIMSLVCVTFVACQSKGGRATRPNRGPQVCNIKYTDA